MVNPAPDPSTLTLTVGGTAWAKLSSEGQVNLWSKGLRVLRVLRVEHRIAFVTFEKVTVTFSVTFFSCVFLRKKTSKRHLLLCYLFWKGIPLILLLLLILILIPLLSLNLNGRAPQAKAPVPRTLTPRVRPTFASFVCLLLICAPAAIPLRGSLCPPRLSPLSAVPQLIAPSCTNLPPVVQKHIFAAVGRVP